MRRMVIGLVLMMAVLPLAAGETVEGLVTVVWGDPPPGGGVEPEPLMQVLQVPLQVLPIGLLRHPVHTYRRLLA